MEKLEWRYRMEALEEPMFTSKGGVSGIWKESDVTCSSLHSLVHIQRTAAVDTGLLQSFLHTHFSKSYHMYYTIQYYNIRILFYISPANLSQQKVRL